MNVYGNDRMERILGVFNTSDGIAVQLETACSCLLLNKLD